MKVPASALLTVDSVPDDFAALHKGITVHGLLASFLAFGGVETSHYAPWKASWPSLQDFQKSMPILWPAVMREPLENSGHPISSSGPRDEPLLLLPPAIGGRRVDGRRHEFWTPGDDALLFRQEKKLEADWEIVSKLFPSQTLQEYTYYWLVVNTRSFYFELFGASIRQSKDDRMVLCPFVDYFNHNDHGVSTTWIVV